jgi:hypothetical protein
MRFRAFAILALIAIAAFSASAQKTEITISLNEQFFDAMLDAMYQNAPPPEIPISKTGQARGLNFPAESLASEAKPDCGVVTLLRENKSMRTAVKFRDGKIYAPVAFNGSYNPPLIGCVDFSGYAETNIELAFDHDTQKLTGNVKVLDVNLNGTAGIGGSLVAKMVQGSIDKKVNPVEILSLDKLSFPFTLPNSAHFRLKPTGLRYEVGQSSLNVIVSCDIVKD